MVDHLVHLFRASASPARPFDEAAFRELADVFDRTADMASSLTNHGVMDGGGRWRERLDRLGLPTLVVTRHRRSGGALPYAHGFALAREIPGAEFLALQETGHELPRRVWDVVVPAILQHTAP